MAGKTHWDCPKPALSETFALAEGDVDCRLESEVAAWLTILPVPVADSSESCQGLLAPDSSEGIEG